MEKRKKEDTDLQAVLDETLTVLDNSLEKHSAKMRFQEIGKI